MRRLIAGLFLASVLWVSPGNITPAIALPPCGADNVGMDGIENGMRFKCLGLDGGGYGWVLQQ